MDKAEISARKKVYYLENRERILARQNAYNAESREIINAKKKLKRLLG